MNEWCYWTSYSSKMHMKSLIRGRVTCQRSVAYGETIYMEEFFPIRIL